MKNRYKYICCLLAIILIPACAVIRPLTGGPDDTTPPEVIEITPPNNTINYSGETIKFKFSEYVDKASAVENIRISPELKAEYSWSGRTLEIEPTEKLKANTTYSFSIEAGYKDLSGNLPAKSQSLIISTGNSIDSASITGIAKNAIGFYVFAYNIANINADTLDIRHTKPDYKVKIGSSGEFTIPALPDGTFRIFLVNDRNTDGLYNEGSEEASTFSNDLRVAQVYSPSDIVFYKSQLFDFQVPELVDIHSIDNQSINLIMTKAIDTLSLNPASFSIIDSISREVISISAALISPKDDKKILLIPAKQLTTNNLYRLKIDNSAFPVKDINHNSMKGIIQSEPFSAAASPSKLPEIELTTIADSAKNISLSPEIKINFNQAMIKAELGEIKFNQANSKKNIQTESTFVNSNSISIKSKQRLISNTAYRMEIPINNMRSAYGKTSPDTIISLNFTTEDLRLNGSVSGSLRVNGSNQFSAERPSRKYLIVLSDSLGKSEMMTTPDSLGKWSFPSLSEGEYLINIIKDKNLNGKFDVGNIFPYQASERYFPISRKIKIVQRWKVDDVILEITE